MIDDDFIMLVMLLHCAGRLFIRVSRPWDTHTRLNYPSIMHSLRRNCTKLLQWMSSARLRYNFPVQTNWAWFCYAVLWLAFGLCGFCFVTCTRQSRELEACVRNLIMYSQRRRANSVPISEVRVDSSYNPWAYIGGVRGVRSNPPFGWNPNPPRTPLGGFSKRSQSVIFIFNRVNDLDLRSRTK